MVKHIFACVFALTLAACVSHPPPAPPNVTRVVSTTSFGMCVGYCTTRLEISEGQAVLVREARGGRGAPNPALQPQRFTAGLSAAEWRDIQRLAAAVDMDALPDVVGCPDCADGGAEGLTIERPGASDSVSFDFGASPPSTQQLLDRVRALRDRLTPQSN